MKFANKTVLVTGAVGQLGVQYCKAFANEGANIMVTDLDKKKCDKLATELCGGDHKGLELDVSDPLSVKNCFSIVEKHYGGIDVLINNAGISVFEPFELRSFEDFMSVMKVNAGGTFLCIQACTNIMVRNKIKGNIINIGSIYGVVSGDPRIYSAGDRKTPECYGASKAAIIQMTKYFAVHLAEYNIRVNCISPGGVFNNQSHGFVEKYINRTPMMRMANETELSDAALFLASDDASYITGQNIVVDGGWTSW